MTERNLYGLQPRFQLSSNLALGSLNRYFTLQIFTAETRAHLHLLAGNVKVVNPIYPWVITNEPASTSVRVEYQRIKMHVKWGSSNLNTDQQNATGINLTQHDYSFPDLAVDVPYSYQEAPIIGPYTVNTPFRYKCLVNRSALIQTNNYTEYDHPEVVLANRYCYLGSFCSRHHTFSTHHPITRWEETNYYWPEDTEGRLAQWEYKLNSTLSTTTVVDGQTIRTPKYHFGYSHFTNEIEHNEDVMWPPATTDKFTHWPWNDIDTLANPECNTVINDVVNSIDTQPQLWYSKSDNRYTFPWFVDLEQYTGDDTTFFAIYREVVGDMSDPSTLTLYREDRITARGRGKLVSKIHYKDPNYSYTYDGVWNGKG